ncbi:MAG: ATP-binding cassette domain-containing protein [Mycobacteriales bacterium]
MSGFATPLTCRMRWTGSRSRFGPERQWRSSAPAAPASRRAALLLRMYDVGSGRVTIGGVDVQDMPQNHLREQVALVPQEVYLFSKTVRDNLVLGRPSASELAVRAAADAAIMTGYVEQLPEGFQTRVGERGVRLSGGQRQRLAVGRALLRDTPVLVFDEATSSLDADNEAAMRTAIARATQGRTTLVIAHRLSTIRAADRLVVLDRGRVVEEGTFGELMTAGGHFAALVDVGFESGPER